MAARVNKPTLSPNLSVLEQIEQSGMKRLLVIGVGCQIQALRAIEKQLGLEKLYVLGTPCVDNVTRAGLQKFLDTTSRSPSTVVYYEFMQDFRVHFKHEDGSTETVPFFGLKTNQLKEVFAPSCLSCFDYVNGLADLVVGYMGAPFGWQWIVVRNDSGQEMLDLVQDQIETQPVTSQGRSSQCGAAKHSGLRQGRDAADVGGQVDGNCDREGRAQGFGVRPVLDRLSLHSQLSLRPAQLSRKARESRTGIRQADRGTVRATGVNSWVQVLLFDSNDVILPSRFRRSCCPRHSILLPVKP